MESEQPNTLTGWLESYFSSTWNPFFSSIGFCALVLVCIKVGISPSEWSEMIVSENGPVEQMSAAIWFMGFVWCLGAAISHRAQAVEWLSIAMFLLLFGLRELDAHIWSTQWNLDKLANYWNPNFPLTEKLLVLGFLFVPCICVGVMLCLRLWNVMGRAWRVGEPWVFHLSLGMILLILCLTSIKLDPIYFRF